MKDNNIWKQCMQRSEKVRAAVTFILEKSQEEGKAHSFREAVWAATHPSLEIDSYGPNFRASASDQLDPYTPVALGSQQVPQSKVLVRSVWEDGQVYPLAKPQNARLVNARELKVLNNTIIISGVAGYPRDEVRAVAWVGNGPNRQLHVLDKDISDVTRSFPISLLSDGSIIISSSSSTHPSDSYFRWKLDTSITALNIQEIISQDLVKRGLIAEDQVNPQEGISLEAVSNNGDFAVINMRAYHYGLKTLILDLRNRRILHSLNLSNAQFINPPLFRISNDGHPFLGSNKKYAIGWYPSTYSAYESNLKQQWVINTNELTPFLEEASKDLYSYTINEQSNVFACAFDKKSFYGNEPYVWMPSLGLVPLKSLVADQLQRNELLAGNPILNSTGTIVAGSVLLISGRCPAGWRIFLPPIELKELEGLPIPAYDQLKERKTL